MLLPVNLLNIADVRLKEIMENHLFCWLRTSLNFVNKISQLFAQYDRDPPKRTVTLEQEIVFVLSATIPSHFRCMNAVVRDIYMCVFVCRLLLASFHVLSYECTWDVLSCLWHTDIRLFYFQITVHTRYQLAVRFTANGPYKISTDSSFHGQASFDLVSNLYFSAQMICMRV